MQREFWNDIGRTSDAGETSTTLLPTPQAVERGGKQKPGSHLTLTKRLQGQVKGKTSEQREVPHCEAMAGTTDPSELIASLEASPANLYQWQEISGGTVMSVGYGTSFAKLWSSCDRGWSWLRTCQDYCQQTLDGFLEMYSETWPRWGSMRNGVAYRQPPLISRISDGESSLLPTIRASDATHGGPNQRDSSGRPALSMAVQLLPTPRVEQGGGQRSGDRSEENATLGQMARKGRLATRTSRDHKSGKASQATHDRNSRPLSEQAGGLLNPQFVEAIMGFPIGFTDCDALETPLSPKSRSGSDDES